MEVVFMKNTIFQDTFDQAAVRACSSEHVSNIISGNSERKFHAFAAHLFRKWMRYDPENRTHYFRYVLSNVKEVGCQDMCLLLTNTGKTGENISVSEPV